MPTQQYRNLSGSRVGGTTYVIGQNLGWNKDALLGWANREGLAGKNIRDSRSTAAVAADTGTLAHAMIEDHIHGRPVQMHSTAEVTIDLKDRERANVAYSGFARWHRNSGLVIVGTELYGVDEDWQTGFCIDALAVEPGGIETVGSPAHLQWTLLDWKSSKGTYADHFIQAAAYTTFTEAKLALLFGPTRLTGAHVVRVDKTTGGFSHKFWPRDILEHGWAAFTYCRKLHELKWPIEGYCR